MDPGTHHPRAARRTRAVLAALLLPVLLGACGSGEEGALVEPTEPPVETTGPTRPAEGKGLVGTLGGDPGLEGGCAWVETADGTRYEVQYPAGYEVRFDPLELVGPDGEVVAAEGEEVTITGAVDPGMMSFCQIGEIFVATAVDS